MKVQDYRDPNDRWTFWETVTIRATTGYMLLQLFLLRRNRRIIMRDIVILKKNKKLYTQYDPENIEPRVVTAIYPEQDLNPMVIQINGVVVTGPLQLTMTNVDRLVMIPGKILNIVTK